MKHFNTAGPSVAGMHFMIDPLVRIDIENIESLIEDQRYFVLHAPRQTGKTTCLLALMKHLNAQTTYRALYVNIEAAQAAHGDVDRGMEAIVGALASAASVYWGDETAIQATQRHDTLTGMLQSWSQASTKPLVILFDQVEQLIGDALLTMLRQIRAGHAQRPQAFPQSVVLCGVSDLRKAHLRWSDGGIITGGYPLSIFRESVCLGNLNREETIALWQQHTTESGQPFDPAIWPELWADTEGQPWLVNALGHECTWEDRAARDRSTPITLERYKAARERLIYSRTTHLDALSDKLREPRVNRIVADVLASEDSQGQSSQYPSDDQEYVADLGLIATRPQVRIANRIYREVIPRELTWVTQTRITHEQSWYLTPQRTLDMPKLLSAFQQFFREHSDAWIDGFSFKEAGPQLLMQAFLQRIVNGGGRINREYGLGRKRTDLFLEWPIDEVQGFFGPVQRVVIELKLWKKGSLEAVLADGLPQTVDYAKQCGADEAHLIVFDRRPDSPWDERIWQREATEQGWALGVWGA